MRQAPSTATGHPAPFSIRFTAEERARLDQDAGKRPIAAHIRERLFGDAVSPRKATRKKPRLASADQAALGRILGALGASRLSSNLNQIAKAANMGALPVTPELIAELHNACTDIQLMRRELIAAVGLREEGE